MSDKDEVGSPSNWAVQWDPGKIVNVMNMAKEMTIRTLVREGYLTHAQGKEAARNYAITFRMKNWWGRVIEKIQGKVKKGYIQYEMIKMVSDDVDLIDIPPENSEDNNPSARFEDLEVE